MSKKNRSFKDFFTRNKTKILFTALVATATIAGLQYFGIRSLNRFLEEKNLIDEYYTPEG